VKNNQIKVYLIVSPTFYQNIKEVIENNNKIVCVFIYGLNDKNFFGEKINNKILYITFNYEEIKQRLQEAISPKSDTKNRMTWDMLSTLSLKAGYYFEISNSCTNYIFLESLSTLMDQEKLSLDQSKQDFLNYCKEHYKEFAGDQKHLTELEEDVKSSKFEKFVVNWFSKETFLYKLLNNSFRLDDLLSFFKLRYFIYHLNKELKKINRKLNSMKVYRQCKMDKKELKKLLSNNEINNSTEKILLLRGYITANSNLKVVEKQIRKSNNTLECHSVLFIFEITEKDSDKIYNLRDFWNFEVEEEFLINNYTFVKINSVEVNSDIKNKNFEYKITCSFINFSDIKNKFNYLPLNCQDEILKLKNYEYSNDTYYLLKILHSLKKNELGLHVLQDTKILDEGRVNYFNGMFYENKQELEKSLNYYESAVQIIVSNKGEEASELAEVYNNMGLVYIRTNLLDMAEEYLDKAKKIVLSTLGKENILIANIYSNLGWCYAIKGFYENAINYYQMNLKILESFYGEENAECALCYVEIAELLTQLGEFDQAIEIYNRALNIFVLLNGEYHSYVATIYNNIGLVFMNKWEFEKALEFFEKSIKYILLTVGENHPELARSYVNIGLVNFYQGEYDMAIELYQKALQFYLDNFEWHSNIPIIYNNIGLAFDGKGSTEKANSYFEKSLIFQL
jgi:tetratricopeptide (TPR) repeat protein